MVQLEKTAGVAPITTPSAHQGWVLYDHEFEDLCATPDEVRAKIALRVTELARIAEQFDRENPPKNDGLPAFKITRDDGKSYVTSMARGTTLEQARAYFFSQTFTDANDKAWNAVEVEYAA